MSTPAPRRLRIAFVTGASPEKWFRRFSDRTGIAITPLADDDPLALIAAGEADMAIFRRDGIGTEAGADLDESLHRIHIYDEAWGVAFEKEHVFSVLDSVDGEELADEILLLESTSASALREMLPVVATGAGIALGPRPILRTLAKKAVGSADVREADELVEKTSIWLAWPKNADDDWRQEFVGVVQGRKEGSRRSVMASPEKPAKNLSAREKTLAKQERRQAAGKKGGPGGKTGKPGGKTGPKKGPKGRGPRRRK